jgi:hypothetical protein
MGSQFLFKIDPYGVITKILPFITHMIGGTMGAKMVCSMVPMPRDNGE